MLSAETPSCSFCGASNLDRARLVEGPGGIRICNQCVDLCVEILEEQLGRRWRDATPAVKPKPRAPWPPPPMGAFKDEQLGVFSSRLVMDQRKPILLAFHDEEGDWQFLAGDEQHAEEFTHVHLGHVLERDCSIRALEDLPAGWKAWRGASADDWVREPIPCDQRHVERPARST
jgi:hypothetical protein